jgi:hypothetical protein
MPSQKSAAALVRIVASRWARSRSAAVRRAGRRVVVLFMNTTVARATAMVNKQS